MSRTYTSDDLHLLRESPYIVQPAINLRKMVDSWLPKPVLIHSPPPKKSAETSPPKQSASTYATPSSSRSVKVEKFDTSALEEKYPQAATSWRPNFPRFKVQNDSSENPPATEQLRVIIPATDTVRNTTTEVFSTQGKKLDSHNILISLDESSSGSSTSSPDRELDHMFDSVLAQISFPAPEMSAITDPYIHRDSSLPVPDYFQHICAQQKYLKVSPEEVRLKERHPEILTLQQPPLQASKPTTSTVTPSANPKCADTIPAKAQRANPPAEKPFPTKLTPDKIPFATPPSDKVSSEKLPLAKTALEEPPSEKTSVGEPAIWKPLVATSAQVKPRSLTPVVSNALSDRTNASNQTASSLHHPASNSIPSHLNRSQSGRHVQGHSSQVPLDSSAFTSALEQRGLHLGAFKQASSPKDEPFEMPEATFVKRDPSKNTLARTNPIFDKSRSFPALPQVMKTKQPKPSAASSTGTNDARLHQLANPRPQEPKPMARLPPRPASQRPTHAQQQAPSFMPKAGKAMATPSFHVTKNTSPSVEVPQKQKHVSSTGSNASQGKSLKFNFGTDIPKFRVENSDFHQSRVRMVPSAIDPPKDNSEAVEDKDDSGHKRNPSSGATTPTQAESFTNEIISGFERLNIGSPVRRGSLLLQGSDAPNLQTQSPAMSSRTAVETSIFPPSTMLSDLLDNMPTGVSIAPMQLTKDDSVSCFEDDAPREYLIEPTHDIEEDTERSTEKVDEDKSTKDAKPLFYRYAFRSEEGRWPANDNEIIEWSQAFQAGVTISEHGVSFEDLEAISFCVCPTGKKTRQETVDNANAPPLYPFFFRLVKERWPSSDEELEIFSSEAREQMMSDEDTNVGELEGFESYAFCDCAAANELRNRMTKESIFGEGGEGVSPHSCDKFQNVPVETNAPAARFKGLIGRLSPYAGHYAKEHRRVWASEANKDKARK